MRLALGILFAAIPSWLTAEPPFLEGRVTDELGRHVFTVVPRNEPYRIVIISTPKLDCTDDPEGLKKRKARVNAERVEIASPEFRVTDPNQHEVVVRVHKSSDKTFEMQHAVPQQRVEKCL